MKHLKLFLEYYSDVKNKIDEILDKISDKGIDSLTPEELALLNAQKEGDEASQEAYDKLTKKDVKKVFKSDSGHFEFHLTGFDSEDSESDDGILTKYHGIMILPDIETDDGKIIKGDVEGSLIMNEHGMILTSFEKDGYTDFDFVEGLEYEYDEFVHEISIELANSVQ